MKMTHGLPRIVHHLPNVKPNLFLMHLHMITKILEAQECIKNLILPLKAFREGKQLQDGIKVPGIKTSSMVISFLVLILVIRLWIVDPMEEEVLEALMTKLGVGHVIVMVILRLIVIQ